MSTLDQEIVVAGDGTGLPNLESSRSGMSWGAIVGGGVAALGVTLVLLALGSGLGLSSVSPYGGGATAAGIGLGAVIWLVLTQWLASAFGGYLTGRLRTKWAAMNSDEVMFRDTAHGFLSWALATVVMLLIVGWTAAGGVNVAASVMSGAAQGATQAAAANADSLSYSIDALFRPAAPTTGEAPAAPAAGGAPAAGAAPGTPAAGGEADYRGEATRILQHALSGELSDADRTYLAQTIAARTGLSQEEAEQRIDQAIASAKESAESARKAGVAASFAAALSLAVGAFVAAVAGALGGRHRDEL